MLFKILIYKFKNTLLLIKLIIMQLITQINMEISVMLLILLFHQTSQ
jgi:hypothetical protein